MRKLAKPSRELRAAIKNLLSCGGRVLRDSGQIIIEVPDAAKAEIAAVRSQTEELASFVLPSVTGEEADSVREVLREAGVQIVYVNCPEVARRAVDEICSAVIDVIGLDFETEVLPAFRHPIEIKFNQDGTPAVRQPRDGAAGAALDPYRSKVRLVQAWAGGGNCYIFDMCFVDWADIRPIFDQPLAIFNATFEVKRLIHEANIEPAARVYDVMTAHWLTDGQRPSLGQAAKINYNIDIPKTLGASDWSADALSQEQLEYAALDAVLCRLIWLTQHTEIFDELDKQAQEVADGAIKAIARMELAGMPVDIDAHRYQIAQWEDDLQEALANLQRASPYNDIQSQRGLQKHLREQLDDKAFEEWPRTDSGLLVTARQQLKLNVNLPAIAELLRVRGLKKLIQTFGESLLQNINPVTGRLHASFLITGASTGRFSARDPNLQQMPKGKQKDFRSIFAAPPGYMIMALDYSQIELRAVGELISDWFGCDSILRQSFAKGLDAHTATAMSMTGKKDPKDVTRDERQLAKPCNFGLLYRMGDNGFFNYLRANFMPEVTFEQACDLKDAFFAGYPDMAKWQDEYASHSRQMGYTQTVAGRRWRWHWRAQEASDLDEDEPFYSDKLMGFSGSYAVNHPVQGSCAEVMMLALAKLDDALPRTTAQLIATVHDEAVLLVADDPIMVQTIAKLSQEKMTEAFLEVFPEAPTLNLVDPAVGPTWGSLEPLDEWLKNSRDKNKVASE
jgi:DNA polymerase-1